MTGPQLQCLLQQIQRFLHRCPARVRPEILILVFLHLVRIQHPRVFFIYRHVKIRIALAVLQEGVVFRLVFLNEITLQDQRLRLRVRHDVLEAADVIHHLQDLRRLSTPALEILAHAVFQHDRLPDVDHLIQIPVHQIDAGKIR